MTVEIAERQGVARDQAYIYAPVRARLSTVLSGVLVNLFMAWACFAAASFGVMPEDTGWLEAVAFAALNGVLVIGLIVGSIAKSLWMALSQWDVEVGTILMLPQSLDQGVQAAETGGVPLWAYMVMALGLINLSLAVFNLLPLYPLDGYHASAAVVDGVRRVVRGQAVQPLTEQQMAWYSRSTGLVLTLFVVSMFTRDVARLLGG